MKLQESANINFASIVAFVTDCIVNAAKESLSGGGGVDGAVHSAAGHKELQALCEKIRQATPAGQQPCPPGQARLTNNPKSSTIPTKYIMHAVGPRCTKGQPMTPKQRTDLKNAYLNSLLRANAFNQKSTDPLYYEFKFVQNVGLIASIAFPPISTGIFGCDKKEASELAVEATIEFFINNPNTSLTEIVFVCGGPNQKENQENFELYKKALENIK